MKALFIPLKAEYYNTFLSGEKKTEYRKYGPRWNEETCVIGRPVTLSKGYGKKGRVSGVITGFRCAMAMNSRCDWQVLKSVYPDLKSFEKIAEIDIEVLK